MATKEEIRAQINEIENAHRAPTQYRNMKSKTFENEDFSGKDLTGTNMVGATFKSCNFDNCIMFYVNARDAVFGENTTFNGVQAFGSLGLKDKQGVSYDKPQWMDELGELKRQLHEITE